MIVYNDGSGYTFINKKDNWPFSKQVIAIDKIYEGEIPKEDVISLIKNQGGMLVDLATEQTISIGNVTQNRDFYYMQDFIAVVYTDSTSSRIFVDTALDPSLLRASYIDPTCYRSTDFARSIGQNPTSVISFGKETFCSFRQDVDLSGIAADYYCLQDMKLVAAFGLHGQQVPCYYYPKNLATAKLLNKIWKGQAAYKLPLLFDSPATDEFTGVNLDLVQRSSLVTAKEALQTNLEKVKTAFAKKITVTKFSELSGEFSYMIGTVTKPAQVYAKVLVDNIYSRINNYVFSYLSGNKEDITPDFYLSNSSISEALNKADTAGRRAQTEYYEGLFDQFVIIWDGSFANLKSILLKKAKQISDEVIDEVKDLSTPGSSYVYSKDFDDSNNCKNGSAKNQLPGLKIVNEIDLNHLFAEPVSYLDENAKRDSVDSFLSNWGGYLMIKDNALVLNETLLANTLSTTAKNVVKNHFNRLQQFLDTIENPADSILDVLESTVSYKKKDKVKLVANLFPRTGGICRQKLASTNIRDNLYLSSVDINNSRANLKLLFKLSDWIWWDHEKEFEYHGQVTNIYDTVKKFLKNAFSKFDPNCRVTTSNHKTVRTNSLCKWSRTFVHVNRTQARTVHNTNWSKADIVYKSDDVRYLDTDKINDCYCCWTPMNLFEIELTVNLTADSEVGMIPNLSADESVRQFVANGATAAYKTAFVSNLVQFLDQNKIVSMDSSKDVLFGLINNRIVYRDDLGYLTHITNEFLSTIVEDLREAKDSLTGDICEQIDYFINLYQGIPEGVNFNFINKKDLASYPSSVCSDLAPLNLFFGGV